MSKQVVLTDKLWRAFLVLIAAPVKSGEIARKIRAVTDLWSKQLQLLCDLITVLRQSSIIRRNGETIGLPQGSSRAPNTRFDREEQVQGFCFLTE